MFPSGHKINFRSHKKDSKRIKKRKICTTGAWKAYKLTDFYFTFAFNLQSAHYGVGKIKYNFLMRDFHNGTSKQDRT